MAHLGFGVYSTGSLSDSLNQLPDEAKQFLRYGYNLIAKIPREQWSTLLNLAISRSSSIDFESESKISAIGLESRDAAVAMNAAQLAISVISYRDESPSDFVDIAVGAKILSAEDAPSIVDFLLAASASRDAIRESFDSSALQNETLPSLRRFEVSLDVRLEFTESEISRAAPVVVAHLDTDAENMEIWFQMTPYQVTSLLTKLQKIANNIEAAEKLVSLTKK